MNIVREVKSNNLGNNNQPIWNTILFVEFEFSRVILVRNELPFFCRLVSFRFNYMDRLFEHFDEKWNNYLYMDEITGIEWTTALRNNWKKSTMAKYFNSIESNWWCCLGLRHVGVCHSIIRNQHTHTQSPSHKHTYSFLSRP